MMALTTQLRTLVTLCPVCNTHLCSHSQTRSLGFKKMWLTLIFFFFWPTLIYSDPDANWFGLLSCERTEFLPESRCVGVMQDTMQMQCLINHQQLHGSMDYSQVREDIPNRAHAWVSRPTFLLLCCDISLIDNLCAKNLPSWHGQCEEYLQF